MGIVSDWCEMDGAYHLISVMDKLDILYLSAYFVHFIITGGDLFPERCEEWYRGLRGMFCFT